MAVTYTRLILDINAPTPAITTAVQQDIHSRYLDVTLTDAGIPVDLRENEVKIFGKKPDGTEFYNNGEVTNATEGRCQFEMTQQALAAVGEVKAQIEIWKIGKGVEKPEVLKNIPFTVNVVTKLRVDKNLESTNEYGTLTMLFHYIQSYFDNIDALLEKMKNLDTQINDLKSSVGGIKSVQKGTFIEQPVTQEASTAIQINIAAVEPGKTFVILNGGTSSGFAGSPSAARGYISAVRATSFTYQTAQAQSIIKNPRVSYQVIEFK